MHNIEDTFNILFGTYLKFNLGIVTIFHIESQLVKTVLNIIVVNSLCLGGILLLYLL